MFGIRKKFTLFNSFGACWTLLTTWWTTWASRHEVEYVLKMLEVDRHATANRSRITGDL
jgi:hypothetical protein